MANVREKSSGWSNDETTPTRKLESAALSAKDMLARMEKMSDKEVKFKGSIFGMQGTGKTKASLELAQALVKGTDKPGIMYVDTAENWVTIKNHQELLPNVIRYRYSSWDDMMQLQHFIITKQPPFDKIGAFVIDEYNSHIEYDLAWITQQRSKHAELDDKDYRDPFFPQRPDYLAVMHRSNILIDALMKLDIHLIFISHAAVDKDSKWVEPDMPAATRKGFMRKIFVVAYAEVNDKAPVGERYTFRLAPLVSKKIGAKGRIGGLGDVATMPQIIKAYKQWGVTPDKTESIVPEKKAPPIAVKQEEVIEVTEPAETQTPVPQMDDLLAEI